MDDDQIAELARLMNKIMAEKLGAPEGTEFMTSSPELKAQVKPLAPGKTIEDLAQELSGQILKIMDGDF
jgi:hypothetical protein